MTSKYCNKSKTLVRISHRMRLDNPMKNLDVLRKNVASHRKRYDTGLVIPTNFDYRLGYIFGLILGDGHLHKNSYNIRIESKDVEHLKFFERCINEKFNYFRVRWYQRQGIKNTIYSVNVTNKTIYRFIKSKIQINALFREILANEEVMKGLIAGFFDAEGCICLANNRCVFSISNGNLSLLNLIKTFLRSKGFHCKIITYRSKRQVHRIVFVRPVIEQWVLFLEYFQPKIPRKTQYKVRKSRKGANNPSFREDISTKEIIKLRREGCKISQISKLFNCSSGLVWNRLKEFGGEMEDPIEYESQ